MPTSVARIEATIGIATLDHAAHLGSEPDATLIAQDLLTATNNAVDEAKALKHRRRAVPNTSAT